MGSDKLNKGREFITGRRSRKCEGKRKRAIERERERQIKERERER